MTVTRLTATAFIFATLAVTAPVWSQTADEVQKIESAMPTQAPAKPAKPRRVLVFRQAIGFHHASIPVGNKAFQLMGEKSGAFTADISSDPAVLAADNLAKYDAIILNNTTGDFLTTDSVRQGLLDFVKSGKGLVGIHAASDSNYKWPEFGDMLGGYFDQHPWHSNDTVTLKIDEPSNPVAKAFDGKPFTVKDEIYQFKEPYSRQHELVLTSLDTSKTNMKKKGVKRTDGDFAVSWVRKYGEGRVFYCSLGHNSEIYWNPVVLNHYLAGIQFALGDLEAPAESKASGGADEEAVAPAKNVAVPTDINTALSELKGYDFGKERAFLITLDETIRRTTGKEEQRNKLANQLAEIANDQSLTYAARELALRRIELIGKGPQVDKIQGLLTGKDEKIAEMARQAVSAIPGDKADKALVNALDETTGSLKEGIILSLGKRRADSAVKALTAIARSGDSQAAHSAMLALGDIASPAAGKALLDDIRPPDAAREAWFMAMNDAAASLGKSEQKLAERLYERVMQLGGESPARLAAFKGSAMLQEKPEAVAIKTLGDSDEMLSQVSRELLVRGKDSSITPKLLDLLNNAQPEQKIEVTEILGARGDKAALDPITKNAEQGGGNIDLQVASIRALETLGNEKTVPLLVKVAAESKGPAKAAAETTLKEMPVPEVDAEVLKLATSAESPDQQVVAIEAVAARKSPAAMGPLLEASTKEDAKVATAAFKAAADLSTDQDLDALLKAHAAAKGEKVLREAARAITVSAEQVKERNNAVQQVLTALTSSPNDQVSASLLGVLGNLGSPAALDAIKGNLDSQNAQIKDAAVRALAAFPDASAMDDLLKIASESDSEIHRVLAVRGVARLLTQPYGKPAGERLELIKKSLDLAKGADEKKAVIGAAADVKVPGILPLILPFLDQPEFYEESVAAILKQAPIANQFNSAETAELLNPLSKKLEKDQWDKLEEALTPSDKTGGVIRAWQASPIYRDEDSSSVAALLDKQFTPETGEGEWADYLWGATDEGDNQGEISLDQYYPGSKNVVIYLRAHVWSPEDRKARLDLGSDDGVKAWLNGKQVMVNYKSRGFTWWGDKTPVDLKRGWNTVLLKVANGSKEWASVARIVDENGKPFSDLKVSAVPQGE